MSSEIVIKVSHLSKCYQIYGNPRDRLLQMLSRGRKQYYREFWALEDLSFEVKKGETVGVIGHNGSGKSTLLQLICGTLNPTGGSVITHGRIAALLELGSGFNPEFTGRENVYMNASVLGLTIEEINIRFDDIVGFADIGDFIEQPVKSYSSGMMLRLAFAVIAHVDADILIIDEALAVGDAVFTQKCMRFIRTYQEKGTLLFVSHDISSVQNLCMTGIWLKSGKIYKTGTAKKVAEAYLQYTKQELYGDEIILESISSSTESNDELDNNNKEIAFQDSCLIDNEVTASVRNNIQTAKGWNTGKANIVSVELTSLIGSSSGVFKGGERVRMTLRAMANEPLDKPILGFLVRDRLGQDLFGENTFPFTSSTSTPIAAGKIFEGIFEFTLPMLPNGQYAVMASVANGDLYNNVQHHWLHDALIINVTSSKIRWGLVGIPFERVELKVINQELDLEIV